MVRTPHSAWLLALAFSCAAESACAFQVVATEPTGYALGVAREMLEIRITFDDVPFLSDPAQVRVAGVMSGLHAGTVEVDGMAIVFTPEAPLFPGELVAVNLRSDLTGLGGGALTGGYFFGFTAASASVVPQFTHRVGFGTAARPYFIHGGDLDGDGMPDVAAPNEDDNSVSIFLNDSGTGDLSTHTEYGVGQVPSSVFGEDFDNDGDQDLATADITSSTMSVLLNDGDGTFTFSASYAAGSVTRQVHGGDFDGDNDVDVATTSNGSGAVVLFRNEGDGTFTPTTLLGVGNAPFAIRAGDLDNDGHLDIAVANRTGDDLTVMLNDGVGNFVTADHYPIGNGPWCLNGNDLDGDGDFDLVSVASQANRLVVLKNDGSGAFSATPYVCDVFPLGVFAADLDGDGDIDATASNFSGASVDIFLNDGSGVMSAFDRLELPNAGTYTWAHDLDGDGDLDISTLDELSDSLFVYYNGDELTPVEDDDGAAEPAPNVESPSMSVRPNPIGSGTAVTVRIDLPLAMEMVTVDVFAPDGRRVRSLGRRVAVASSVSVVWDGADDAGRPLASGRYLVVARAGGTRVAESVAIVR